MAKNIILLSDGTGNSAGKLRKTNVWRLYQALDLSTPPKPGQPRQITCYDAIAKRAESLAQDVSGSFVLHSPDSRAGLVHFRRIAP